MSGASGPVVELHRVTDAGGHAPVEWLAEALALALAESDGAPRPVRGVVVLGHDDGAVTVLTAGVRMESALGLLALGHEELLRQWRGDD